MFQSEISKLESVLGILSGELTSHEKELARSMLSEVIIALKEIDNPGIHVVGESQFIVLPSGVTLGDCDLSHSDGGVARAFSMRDGTWMVVAGEKDSKWEGQGHGEFADAIVSAFDYDE